MPAATSITHIELLRRIALLFAVALAPGAMPPPAAAAPPQPDVADRFQPMRVRIVRDAAPGCAPGCAEWIAATGSIVPGTAARFEAVLRQAAGRKLPVLIDSVGGSITDAMAMGRRIRALHLDVAVTRTVLDPCDPADHSCRAVQPDGSVRGHPVGPSSICASACVLVLAAGEKRDAAPWTPIGVHQVIMHETLTQTRRLFRVVYRESHGVRQIISRTLISEQPVSSRMVLAKPSQHTYDEVETYLSGMGITPQLETLMLGTPPTALHWMTALEEDATRIVTDRVDGETVVAMAERQMSPPPSAAAAQASSLAEQAFLVDGAMPDAQQKIGLGRVIWSIEQPGAAADPQRTVLHADVEVPDANLKVGMRMERVTDPAVDAAFRIVIATAPLSARPLSRTPMRAVAGVGMPKAGDLRAPPRFVLTGMVKRIAPAQFEVDLTKAAPDDTINMAMIREGRWMTIPLVLDEGPPARLVFEHGQAGQPLVDQAFRAWQQAPGAVTGATP